MEKWNTRYNFILAEPEEPDPPQSLDFVDAVDDDSDAELHVEAALAEAEAELAMAEDEHSSGVNQADSGQNEIGFFCPFEECKSAAARWLSVDGLTKHKCM